MTYLIFQSLILFSIPTNEGWGLTNDGTNLIMSSGTNVLTWVDTTDFSVIKELTVADDKQIIHYLKRIGIYS